MKWGLMKILWQKDLTLLQQHSLWVYIYTFSVMMTDKSTATATIYTFFIFSENGKFLWKWIWWKNYFLAPSILVEWNCFILFFWREIFLLIYVLENYWTYFMLDCCLRYALMWKMICLLNIVKNSMYDQAKT